MAALGEVPFGRYYGSVDSTPLFVMLAGAYYRRTGDRAPSCETIAPDVQRALDWIERYGDVDGDGFVEYARRTAHGLVQQGWKDSHDSVFHADGTLAEAPIALCEVQAYVYARLAGGRRHRHRARPPRRSRGLAAQGGGAARPLRGGVLGRAAGHVRAGARRAQAPVPGRQLERRPRAVDRHRTDPARARRVADGLMSEESFSGWGIRTIAVVRRCATTRCRITTARCGRTTTR